ncbi:unnamed protein product [Calypogeia fissa]
MDHLRTSICTVEGGCVGFRKVQLKRLLATLLQDPLLEDPLLKKKPSLKELETLIGVQKGSAMMLCIRKMDGTKFDVAVWNKASVRDIKSAIERKVDEMVQENLEHRRISWAHVWGNFCLVYNNEKLLKDSSLLSKFGIKNGDELSYAHHLASREGGCHSYSKQRRFFHGLRRTISFK